MRIAVVLPCYRVERQIEQTIRTLPDWVDHIVAVNDASPDRTGEILTQLQAEEERLEILTHESNQGVGGAMVTGFRAALASSADVVVKMDSDGQMDPAQLPPLLRPILEGRADMTKGTRFQHLDALSTMPKTRLFGNVVLSFLTKVASGCWHVYDVQNGYLALTGEVLRSIELDRLDRGYCFENSLLVNVSQERFRIADVPMPAVYGDEESSLRILRSMAYFPPKLALMFVRRLFVRYGIYDLSPILIYFLAALLLGGFGVVFGGYQWWRSISTGVPATTGTVVLALMPTLMSFNFLLQAVDLDIRNSPRPGRAERQIHPEDVEDFLRSRHGPPEG